MRGFDFSIHGTKDREGPALCLWPLPFVQKKLRDRIRSQQISDPEGHEGDSAVSTEEWGRVRSLEFEMEQLP